MTAGLIYQPLPNGVVLVVRAAPILKYMVGWTEAKVIQYCETKRWSYENVEEHSPLA